MTLAGTGGLPDSDLTRPLAHGDLVSVEQRAESDRVAGAHVDDFEELHRGKGVDLRLETGVEALLGEETVSGVKLAGGETLAADLVLVSETQIVEGALALLAR